MADLESALRDRRLRRRHAVQRFMGRVVAPFWIPLAALVLRFGFGYRIEGILESRARYRRVRDESDAPLLVCANHLTLIDSFIVGWALAGPWRHVARFDEMPWNVPEATNFATGPFSAVATYLWKCIPIVRGGPRDGVALVLARVAYLLGRGETALIFPEGGRSRSGRVDVDAAAWGVGRIVNAVPGCRVLCVYLRGRGQDGYGDFPSRGERFRVQLEVIEPKSDFRGARRSRDLARQIAIQLARMEERHFDDRQ